MYEYSELENKKELGKDDLVDSWRLMIRGEIKESWKKLYAYKQLIASNVMLQEMNKDSISRLETHLKKKEAEKFPSET